jgi:uncharacterized protein (DUF1778 family)
MTEIKAERMHLRVAASDDELFRSAAAAKHESLSEFLVGSGRERAERILADRTRFLLSASDWDAFTAALDRPARAVPAVDELMNRSRPTLCRASATRSHWPPGTSLRDSTAAASSLNA